MVEPIEIAHSDLVQDLRLLREKGIWKLRGLQLPALNAAGRAIGLNPAATPSPTAVEQLLRQAVDALGEEEPGTAAQYLFGLVRGTSGRKPTDLREKAASIYNLSAETFRKEPERLLIARVAEEILTLCHAAVARGRAGDELTPAALEDPPSPHAASAASPSRPHPQEDEAPHEHSRANGETKTRQTAPVGRDQFVAGRDQVNIFGNQTVNVSIVQVTQMPPVPPGCTLPPDISAFTGRDHELRQIVRSAEGNGARADAATIHAIDGMPGVGKTALAIHAAHVLSADSPGRSSDQFPDGRLFLDLHAHTPGHVATPPADALAVLLIADGVDPQYLPDTVDGRSAMWRDRLAGRRVLLVLDNVADSAQVSPLIPGLPGCLTLITSRRRLGDLPGNVNVLSLDVLSPLSAREMFLKLAIRGSSHSREVTESAANELVTLAAYLPLAISLLARVFLQHLTWTMHDLLAETRARLLTMTAEYATVAAAFDLSYEVLPPGRQQFFRRIGLHPGVDLDANAAAALGATTREEAIVFLDALRRDHLLMEVGYRRYGLHDLIRSYVSVRAAEDPPTEREHAVIRVLDYYQWAAELADTHLARQTRPRRSDGALVIPLVGRPSGGVVTTRSISATSAPDPHIPPLHAPDLTDRAQALNWLRTERSNLLAWIALAANFDPARGVALTAALADLLRLDGPWDDAAALHTAAAAMARRIDDPFGEAEALSNLAQIRVLSGDLSGGKDAARRAQQLFHECGDNQGEANAIADQAGIWYRTANYAEAAEALEQALDLYRTLHDRRGEANTLTDLGNVYYRIGDAAGAGRAMERALTLHHDLGNPEGEAFALTNLAIVHYRTGNLAEAAETLEHAVRLCRSIGDRRGEANALSYLGAVRRLTGDQVGAVEALTPALDLHRELGHRLGVANTLLYLGSATFQLGNIERAASLLEQTLALYRDLEDRLGEANTLLYLGVLHRDDGDLDLAETELQRSLRLYCDMGDSGGEAEALNEAGTLYRIQGELEQARSHHQQALELAHRIDSAWDQGHAHAGLARCAQVAGRHSEATAGLQQAMNIFRKMGVPESDKIALEYDALTSANLELTENHSTRSPDRAR